MWLESDKAQVEYLFVQNIIVADKVNDNIQKSIGTAAGSIPESLHRHDFSEGRIEKINKRNYLLFWHKWLP
jgi:hypothetical protein